jgi:hypothetical protein
MMQVLVILTVQRTAQQATVYQTVNALPGTTRSALLNWAMDQVPERYRGGKGEVVFFYAEPDDLAPGPLPIALAPEASADSAS